MPELFHIPSKPIANRDIEARIWRDQWLVASTLQKAIRRGEVDIVHRTAVALQELRGTGVWRRLIIIAFEDIGIGAPQAVCDITMQAIDAIRRKRPVAQAVVMRAARTLADASKDRTADYLMSVVALSPALEPVRKRLGAMTIDQQLGVVGDGSLSLEERCCAAWYCSGLNIGNEKRLNRGDRGALMRLYRALGVAEPLVTATEMAATLTREPICVFLPLIWLVSRDSTQSIVHPAIRPSPRVGSMPLYALGMHTRTGRQAIAAFTKVDPVREIMERWAPPYRAREIAFNAEFHVDGGSVAPTLQWPDGQRLKQLAVETDLVNAGAMGDGTGPILAAFAENLHMLDAIRERLLMEGFGQG